MLQLKEVCKVYRKGTAEVRALDGVDVHVNAGEFVVVRGPSGSGKTTLLLTFGAMLRPSAGQVLLDGKDIYALSDAERSRFRAEHIGFVFQMFHLVPYLTVIENVLTPSATDGSGDARRRATDLLGELGLGDRMHHKPSELSAGERQRVALARALIVQPKLILADEPTGNLDPDNAGEVMRRLGAFSKAGGTVVVVTHGEGADPHADRICQLREGRISAN